jgi:hypothetical protein
LPNIGYLEIWIQRIVIKTVHEIQFEEPICRKLNDSNISLWNSDWLNNNSLKRIIANASIVDRSIIEDMNTIIEEKEVSLFGSKNIYLL